MMLLTLLLTVFSVWAEDFKSGPWRFELNTDNATVPFIAELHLKNKKVTGKIFNGPEEIPLDRIVYSQGKLSIPVQDYEITLELEQKSPTELKGRWVRHNKDPKIEILLAAKYGETERFPGEKLKPKLELDGKWAVEIRDESSMIPQPGVVVFKQNGNHLTGSILTPTGDMRYMEGYVSGNDFEMASFDGMFNYIFKGTILGGKLQALMLNNFVTRFNGKKDPNAVLPDAYGATKVNELDFNFKDVDGNTVKLKDPKFKGKAVIVQIYGTWCPNCHDEMKYLIPWYEKNKKRGVEIVALAFERSLSEADAKRQLKKVVKKQKIPYPVLLAGSTSADKPMDKIPGLKNFISFPTTIFLNRKHEVVKVHAGFSGPGTGEYFETWKKEFENLVTEITK